MLKAQHTSLTQQTYYVQVEPIRPPLADQQDAQMDEARTAAWDECEAIKSRARADAAEIIRQAQEDAQQILDAERERVQAILLAEVQEAKELGYREGYEAACQAAEDQYAGKLDEVELLYRKAVDDRKQYLADSEPLIVDLACAVAQKIMTREVTVDREWVLDVVRAALEEIHDAGQIEVRVHPDDFERVQANRRGLRKEVPGQTELLVLPDRVVEPGGCVVHTAFGNIDARIDTQLEEVRKALQEVAASLDR
ncbi:MAG: FliH/SctL family protein [Tumebacillaceae bacterium]